MISLQHLSALVSHAASKGCKVVLAGDQEQLTAVEGGGAMMLADRLGYARLVEPVRFSAEWERNASLRLRAGDQTALDDYDQHGRTHGAPPDEAMDQAVTAYRGSYLVGHNVLLTAADWARCRELSRRIRDDLIHLGLVDGSLAVQIAKGAQASAGNLIICRDTYATETRWALRHGTAAGQAKRAQRGARPDPRPGGGRGCQQARQS